MPAYTTTNQRLTNARSLADQRRAAAMKQTQDLRAASAARRPVPMPRSTPTGSLLGTANLTPASPAPRPTGTSTQRVGPSPTQADLNTFGQVSAATAPANAAFLAAANGNGATGFENVGQPVGSPVNQQTGGGPFGNTFTGDPAGTTPITGWARQMGFNAPGLDALQREPADIIAALLGPGAAATPLYGMMEPLADDINALLMLAKSGGINFDDPSTLMSNSDTVNWMANVFGGMMTPGGWQVDPRELLGNLFGAPAGVANPLSAFLNIGDPQQSVRNALSLMAAVGDAGMNPLMAQAMLGAAQARGTDYRNQVNAGATNLPYTQWLAQNGF